MMKDQLNLYKVSKVASTVTLIYLTYVASNYEEVLDQQYKQSEVSEVQNYLLIILTNVRTSMIRVSACLIRLQVRKCFYAKVKGLLDLE